VSKAVSEERQAWCYLQVKLCDPRLSALSVVATVKALYKYTSFLSFPFPFGKVTGKWHLFWLRVAKARFFGVTLYTPEKTGRRYARTVVVVDAEFFRCQRRYELLSLRHLRRFSVYSSSHLRPQIDARTHAAAPGSVTPHECQKCRTNSPRRRTATDRRVAATRDDEIRTEPSVAATRYTVPLTRSLAWWTSSPPSLEPRWDAWRLTL